MQAECGEGTKETTRDREKRIINHAFHGEIISHVTLSPF
jgi:hypothetical protein